MESLELTRKRIRDRLQRHASALRALTIGLTDHLPGRCEAGWSRVQRDHFHLHLIESQGNALI